MFWEQSSFNFSLTPLKLHLFFFTFLETSEKKNLAFRSRIDVNGYRTGTKILCLFICFEINLAIQSTGTWQLVVIFERGKLTQLTRGSSDTVSEPSKALLYFTVTCLVFCR